MLCINMTGSGNRRYAGLGDIITCSVKDAQPGGTVGMHEVVRAVIVRTVKETTRTLTDEHKRHPTREEIAEASGLDIERVDAALDAPDNTVSLDRPVGEEGDAVLGDLVADVQAPDPFVEAAVSVRRRQIEQALEVLDHEERLVVVKRYGIGGSEAHTLTAIGAMMELSREHVRQIEKRALSKLRHPSFAFGLRYLLEL